MKIAITNPSNPNQSPTLHWLYRDAPKNPVVLKEPFFYNVISQLPYYYPKIIENSDKGEGGQAKQ